MLTRLHWIMARLSAYFRARGLDGDLDDELQSHIELLADDKERHGMTSEQARRSARIELGGIAQIREAHREARSLPFMDILLQDLRYAFRTLRRDRGFTAFAILVVALGLGACATVFSVVDAVLVRPLPFRDSRGLVWISNGGGDAASQTIPVGPLLDLRREARSFSDIAAYYAFYGVGDKKMTGSGEPERLTAVPVSQNFFPLLGVVPRLGRLFTSEECSGNRPVVVLSDALWKRDFASDMGVVGRKLRLNGQSFTVIGVMPSSSDFGSVFAPGSRTDLFLPLPLTPELDRMGDTLALIGRLKPGATLQQAQAEASVLSEPIRVRHNRVALRFNLNSLDEHVRGSLRPSLLVLVFAVGVVMLIVCANLSNLQLARAAVRQKEMAIRGALGAGSLRLLRQMLTEGLVLSCCAAVLGLLMAVEGTHLLADLTAVVLPLRESIRFDLGTFAFTLALAGGTGIVFGLAPALHVSVNSLQDSLKSASRGSSAGKSHDRIRSALVISEIAFACVLLVAAGLLIRSFLQVLDVKLGFQPESAGAIRIDSGPEYATRPQRNAYFNEVLGRVRALPGIAAAGLTDVLPFGHDRSWAAGSTDKVYSVNHPPPDAFPRIVSDGYLHAMGIPLRAGRDLTPGDDASGKPVILINETLARTVWPGRDPVGQILIGTDVPREVVGVVADVRHLALERGSGCEMYVPIRQTGDYASVELVVRSSMSASGLDSAVRAALKPLDPHLPANEFRTLRQLVDNAVSPRRFITMLLGGFSVFALILACLGIYGVISYSVQQRTQEIGIRMALGASAGDLQFGILFQTLKLTAIGMAIGAVAALMLTRALRSLLFGVSYTDAATFAGMLTILGVVALGAGYFPARRASRIDPMTSLREI